MPFAPYLLSSFRAFILTSGVNLCFRNSEFMSLALVSPSISNTVSITFSCAKNLKVGASLLIFQTMTLWSSDPLTNVCPSFEMHNLLTHPSCPVNVFLQNPVLISHNLMVLSLEHEKTKSPSGLKLTYETLWLWPLRVLKHW